MLGVVRAAALFYPRAQRSPGARRGPRPWASTGRGIRDGYMYSTDLVSSCNIHASYSRIIVTHHIQHAALAHRALRAPTFHIMHMQFECQPCLLHLVIELESTEVASFYLYASSHKRSCRPTLHPTGHPHPGG